MGLFTKPVRQAFPELPDSLYFAKVAKLSTKIGQKSQKPYLSWGFEIIQPPHQKRWVWANTQPTVSPKSATGKFLAELGVDIATLDADTFNEQILIGRYVKVLVETTEDAQGNKYQNVTKLMHIPDSEQPLLQSWLAQANVKGPVQIASHVTPAPQVPVLATAPVSFPVAPVAAPAPVVAQPATPTYTQPTPVFTQPVAPAIAAPRKSGFPF